MKALEKITSGVSIALMLLNTFGTVVAGVWLAVLGQWRLIGAGLLLAFIGRFAIGLAMLPGVFFAAPAAALYEKKHFFGFCTFAFLALAYQFIVLTVWCLLSLFIFADRATPSSAIPLLLWSYGVANGTIAYMAHKDMQTGNDAAVLPAVFAQFAYVIAIVVLLTATPARQTIALVFGVVMFVGLLLQSVNSLASARLMQPSEST